MSNALICVVEDDPIMGESLADRFRLEGFDVDWHTDGESALDALRRRYIGNKGENAEPVAEARDRRDGPHPAEIPALEKNAKAGGSLGRGDVLPLGRLRGSRSHRVKRA